MRNTMEQQQRVENLQDFWKLRPIRAQLRILHRADGSVAFQQGDSIVWASAFGPGDIHSSRRIDDRAFLDVQFRPKNTLNKTATEWSVLLREAVGSVVETCKYPRTSIQVTVQELQNGGSLISAAITASCLALLDAGIQMRAVFCGISLVLLENGQLILDPNREQQKHIAAEFIFAIKSATFLDDDSKMISCHSAGRFNYAQFKEAMSIAIGASSSIFLTYRETFQKKLTMLSN